MEVFFFTIFFLRVADYKWQIIIALKKKRERAKKVKTQMPYTYETLYCSKNIIFCTVIIEGINKKLSDSQEKAVLIYIS